MVPPPPPPRNPELPPVPFDALPVLTERVDEPLPPISPAPAPDAQTNQPPHLGGPSLRASPPPAATRNGASDPAFAQWLAQRVSELVREELELLTERVIARLEEEIAQRRQSDSL